ncbi:hypothetical protein [Microbacterium sp. NPDC057650]|uniref:hypothetical protein n=1 Tax=unclassified Microbacterium TaxID=2609290 RepID=UPI00366E15B4
MAGESIDIVTYDGLPISKGGAHSMGTRQAARGFAQFEEFLAASVVTDAEVRWELTAIFSARPAEMSPVEQAIVGALGNRSSRDTVIDGWNVPERKLDDALALLDVKRSPELKAPPHLRVTLMGTVSGVARDPETGRGYAGVSPDACGGFVVDGYRTPLGAVSTRVSLGQHSARLSLFVSLPGDGRLAAAAQHVQQHLPFALSEKHWKRWVPAADGYRAKRQGSPLVEV